MTRNYLDMNLAVDIGNTFIKYAVFENNKIIYTDRLHDIEKKDILDIIGRYSIERSIVSSVRGQEDVRLLVECLPGDVCIFSDKTKLPVSIKYNPKRQLGLDRIANLVGAICKYPDKDILVIDAGTCITTDMISMRKTHLGGSISPGLAMRYRSLYEFTNDLPHLSEKDEYTFMGHDTSSDIISGVQAGILSEIDTIICSYKKEKDDLFVILTGGDTFFFEKGLKSRIFADHDLLLKGLNEILIYNG